MSGTTTEDFILSNIPGVDDGNSDTGGGAVSDGGGADNSGGGGDVGGRSSAEPTSTRTDQQTQDIPRRHDGLVERQSTQDARTRDLVDPRTGRTVARGGIERHVFEEGQRHARENVTLKSQLQAVQQQLANTSETMRVANEMQLSPENQVIALRVMGDFLKDPVRTLQSLVEEVKSKGYPIPFLTEGVSPGMDLNAIQRMIDAKMAPITQAQQRQQQQEAQHAQVAAQLDSFLSTNPEANANLDILADMMKAQPHLNIQQAYTNMIRWSYQHGLDYSQPLRPQIDAVNNGQQQQTVDQQGNPQQPTRPLPHGRTAGGGAQQMNGATAFNENTPWGDIIRHSMQESGMTF